MELNSKEIIEKAKSNLKERIKDCTYDATLDIITNKETSKENELYIKNKIKALKEFGIKTVVHRFSDRLTLDEASELVDIVKKSKSFIIQQPFMGATSEYLTVLSDINHNADVDGVGNVQIGKLAHNYEDALVPCTALGVLTLIEGSFVNPKEDGRRALIVNRSGLIGRPLQQLLINNNYGVTVRHSKCLPSVEDWNSDIIITAVGKRKLYGMMELGASFPHLIIDCSMYKEDGIPGVGDWDKESVLNGAPGVEIASGYGHTGPATIYGLIHNVLKAHGVI